MHYSPAKLYACYLNPKWAQMVLIIELHRLPIQYEINYFIWICEMNLYKLNQFSTSITQGRCSTTKRLFEIWKIKHWDLTVFNKFCLSSRYLESELKFSDNNATRLSEWVSHSGKEQLVGRFLTRWRERKTKKKHAEDSEESKKCHVSSTLFTLKLQFWFYPKFLAANLPSSFLHLQGRRKSSISG